MTCSSLSLPFPPTPTHLGSMSVSMLVCDWLMQLQQSSILVSRSSPMPDSSWVTMSLAHMRTHIHTLMYFPTSAHTHTHTHILCIMGSTIGFSTTGSDMMHVVKHMRNQLTLVFTGFYSHSLDKYQCQCCL